ncbi:hypothetical protein XELAEV_18038404mg [Xenopus laevis]|uniref:Uncharacterized protein n=1 Tax=Xenopus laevis TaxID=8355 RepID=A0A974C668_XENLA|nr:hypothetical protein XELAEV_18038404mg [Xenopus laevis]
MFCLFQKWKPSRSWFHKITVRRSSEFSVQYRERSGRVKRETGTSSSTTNNLTKQQDEDTDLLHSKNQDDIVITMSNGATSTDPC